MAIATDARPRVGLFYPTEEARKLAAGEGDGLPFYRHALTLSGAEVVNLPQSAPHAELADAVAGLDALLLPGGIDVDPAFYGQPPHPALGQVDRHRDEVEFLLLGLAGQRGLPVLGICRGHQVMNVFFGGSLVQDIAAQWPGGERIRHRRGESEETAPLHPVRVDRGSVMAQIVGATETIVNSSHHQAVERIAPGFRATAWSEDGIIEAIEPVDPARQFLLAVQFHPERMVDAYPACRAIFDRLVAEALGFRARELTAR